MKTYKPALRPCMTLILVGLVGAPILFLAPFTHITAKSVRVQTQPKSFKTPATVVQLGVNDPYDAAGKPLLILAQALKKDEVSDRFRVTWGLTFGSWGSNSTALYDRNAGTVTFLMRGGDDTGGSEEHCLYENVTDDILNELADLHKDENGANSEAPMGYFDELTNYGCKQLTLK